MSALADAYSECFATVFAFRAARDDERPGYGAFRSHVMAQLADARRTTEDERLDPRGYAQYAVVALVDETVMSSTWPGAEQWRREPLQVHYYDNLLAGEQFFVRLEELRGDADGELLEVYFLCLCAGFQGRYRDEASELSVRRRKLYQQLHPLELREEKHLTEEAYGRSLERSLARSRFPLWWVAPFIVGAVGLYVAFWVVLNQQVNGLVNLVP
jgi:type IV/VI secretion system ImpK/VasF family protein